MSAQSNDLSRVPRNAAQRFAHIDAMRAFAVLIVVVAHAGLGHFVPGGSGVTMFFTISGFIITYLSLRELDKTGSFDARGFYVRRFLKIGPPLAVLVILPSLVYSFVANFDWPAFLSQIFFVYNWHKIGQLPDVLPGSGVVWSLSIEEQFYIAFAAFWVFAVRSRHRVRLLVGLGVLTILAVNVNRIVLVAGDAPLERIYYGTDTRIDGIALGMLVAVYVWGLPTKRTGRVPPRLGWGSPIVLVLAVLLFALSLVLRDEFFRYTVRFTIQGFAAAMIILYGLSQSSGSLRRLFDAVVAHRWTTEIGLASYSIYLAHLPVLILVNPWVEDLPSAVAISVRIGVGVGVGLLSYRCIEVPVLAWRRRREAPQTESSGREANA